MLELYYFPASTCSLKVRLCLAEKNLDWVPRRMEARDGEHLQLWYLQLNPNGVVPTLIRFVYDRPRVVSGLFRQ